MENDRLKFKSSRGFTLADMLVATAIVVTISVMLVVDFRVGRQRDELRNAGLLLASLLHQAQAYTLAGRTVDSGGAVTYPTGGYGLSLDTQNDIVYIFANETDDRTFSQGAEIWEESYSLADYNTELDENSVCIDLGSGCEAGFFTVDYFFVPPLASRSILGFYLNQGSFEVIIRHPGLLGKGMRLSSSAVTGQVILGPIEDIP